MERFLILKFDENSLVHMPVKMENFPPVFDNSIPLEEQSKHAFVKLSGDGFNIKLVEDLLFSAVKKRKMSLDEKYQITNQVIKELSITARKELIKSTPITLEALLNLVDLTLTRIEENENLQNY